MTSNKTTSRARITDRHGKQRAVRKVTIEVDEEVFIQISAIAEVQERTIPGQIRHMLNQDLRRYHNRRDAK